MYSTSSNPSASIDSYRIDGRMLRFSLFVPRLYNLCKSLGFEAGKIMPSRAFCSDESQGYPIILIAKHFNTFPFNHGRVGGIVAADRHGPHAHHGQDLVIIQASHVGYDPASNSFGVYRRLQTSEQVLSSNCGKMESVLDWYQTEIQFACEHIFISYEEKRWLITIDNQLLNDGRQQGLNLNLNRLIEHDQNGQSVPVRSYSTSGCFSASTELAKELDNAKASKNDRQAIGSLLRPQWYYFKRQIKDNEDSGSPLEQNLLPVMPWILASPSPLLTAAKVSTQIEFDHTYRSIVNEPSYQSKRVFFIAGLNIDISPNPGQLFPLTKFAPWAAYVQEATGEHRIIEQDQLWSLLNEQSSDNPDQTDLEQAIQQMSEAAEVTIPADKVV